MSDLNDNKQEIATNILSIGRVLFTIISLALTAFIFKRIQHQRQQNSEINTNRDKPGTSVAAYVRKNQLSITVFEVEHIINLEGKTPQETLAEAIEALSNPHVKEIEDFSKCIRLPGLFSIGSNIANEYYSAMHTATNQTDRLAIMKKYQQPPYCLLLAPNGIYFGSYQNQLAKVASKNTHATVNVKNFRIDTILDIKLDGPTLIEWSTSNHSYQFTHQDAGVQLEKNAVNMRKRASSIFTWSRLLAEKKLSKLVTLAESIPNEQFCEIPTTTLGMTIPKVDWALFAEKIKQLRYFADCDLSIIPNKPAQDNKQIFASLIGSTKPAQEASLNQTQQKPKPALLPTPHIENTQLLDNKTPPATKLRTYSS